ncbi:MAG TPA: MBOAT family O-acyltransferase [Bacteroidales bacterium]|nr:MBOAT family O-acyltransferase [Bacteroidales bacterium]
MLFNSYTIFIYILFFVLIYNAVKWITTHIWIRNLLIFLGNILILLTLVKEHTLIVISVFSVLIYFIGKILQQRNSKTLLATSLSIILSLFIIRNYPYIQLQLSDGILSFINAPILSVQKLGLSYILFRLIHFLVESYRNHIQRSNFITFLNYILFFPTFIAGPIDTYNNFAYWVGHDRKSYDWKLFFAGISRILIGAVKVVGIVPLIIVYATDYTTLLPDFSAWWAIILSLLAYSAYIYLDFSGYSDITIGTAYLIGIKTPENFNNPYISQSLSEFWKRWHITFSSFLKIYVFKPTILVFSSFINVKHRLLITVLSYIVTFTICGLWHGSSINFVYWGLWHGIGLAINKVWTSQLKSKFAFCNSTGYKIGSIILTFIYVTVGFVFFQYSQNQLIELFKLLS